MDAEEISERARSSISSFCNEECKSYCCRKGYLVLTPHEVDLIMGKTKVQLKEQGHLTVTSTGDYSFFLGYSEQGCPSLKNYKCTIHKNRERPKTCKDYPVFIIGKLVRISSRCLAVRMNLFYPFIREFMQLGYKVLESTDFEDSDTYRPPGIRLEKSRVTSPFLLKNKKEVGTS